MKDINKFTIHRKKNRILLNIASLIFLLMFCSCCYGQNLSSYYPKEGETIKDYTFNDVINYKQTKVSISDFRNKWLILDFWAPGCVGCIESFPKMNKMSNDFKDKVNILLVGLYGTKKGSALNSTKKLYSILSEKNNLNLAVAFDSASFDQNGVQGVPCIIVINPKGEVVAKTMKIDSAMLSCFMAGQYPPYMHYYSKNEKRLDSGYNKKVSLLDQTNFKYDNNHLKSYSKSILMQWDFNMPEAFSYGIKGSTKEGEQRFEVIGEDLPSMLRMAYTGVFNWSWEDPKYTTFNQNLILEVKDREKFNNKNTATGENMYSYSLCGYGTDVSKKRARLLADLENGIGFKSSIETRDVQVWKIVVVNKDKLQRTKSKGGAPSAEETSAKGYILKNIPIENLSSFLFRMLTFGIAYKALPVIINATGENMSIDLNLPSYFEFDKNKEALQNAGLDVVKGTLPMKCIVIKDL